MSLVILIDGHALAYRSFFALGQSRFTSPDGKPAGMLYGFLRQIYALKNTYQPIGIPIFLDPPEGSFRNKVYPEYKAQRDKMPEDLIYQVNRLHSLLDDIGLKHLIMEDYEADDLIASAAVKLNNLGHTVYIYSSDKDLFQVVRDNIFLLRPQNRGDALLIDYEKIPSIIGVTGDRVKDYLALVGDASDNLPGAKGIGPKTTIKILERFKSIDEIYANLDLLSPKEAALLKEERESVYLTYKLVELKTDLEVSVDDLLILPKASEQARKALLDLGFKSLLSEIKVEKKDDEEERDLFSEAEIRVVKYKEEYKVIDTIDELKSLLTKLDKAEIVSVDTETTSLDTQAAELVGISISFEEGYAYYLPIQHTGSNNLPKDEAISLLKPFLEDDKAPKLGHNIKYDYLIFKSSGIDLKGIRTDTMVAAWVLDPISRRYSLDALTKQYLNYDMLSFKELLSSCEVKEFAKVPIKKACFYSCEDADLTLKLWNKLRSRLEVIEGMPNLFYNLEMPLLPILAEMEWHGIAIDKKVIGILSSNLEQRLDELTKKIYALANTSFNLRSPKQVADILFDKLGLTRIRKTKTGDSTDSDVLYQLYNSHEIIPIMIEHRELSKLVTSYLKPLPELCSKKTGRLHPSYLQVGTSTGRLSSNSPNIQNIPIKGDYGDAIRNCFIPSSEDRFLLSFDYSQIELRVLAHYTGHGALVDAFNEDKDIHTLTACEILGKPESEITREDRRLAKSVNFGLVYGQTAHGLSLALGIPRGMADAFIKTYFERFKEVKLTLNSLIEEARLKGYARTIMGRRRQIDELFSRSNTIRKQGERIAMNTPIQGSAADLIKKAMIDVVIALREKSKDTKLIVQVHDELLFEVKEGDIEEAISIIKDKMENALDLVVPIKTTYAYGKTWREAH